MDEMQARLTALLDEGPWRMWKHQPGGAFLLRGDRMGQAERTCSKRSRDAILAAIAATCARSSTGRMLSPPLPAPPSRRSTRRRRAAIAAVDRSRTSPFRR